MNPTEIPQRGSAPAVPDDLAQSSRIAVLIPCYNEELTVARVVADFRAVLPAAAIYVFDNGSSDATTEAALRAGAQVRQVPLKGKGNVVRRMFADIEADAYVLVDGDDTYDAAAAPAMIAQLFDEQLDTVVGVREPVRGDAHRTGHAIGNAVMSRFLGRLFGSRCADIFSGYRIFSRRFVKSFPVLSSGFEIETELTVHALELKLPSAEVVTAFKGRPEGSTSKLSTFRDGFRILGMMLRLFSAERPLQFYGLWAIALATLAVVLAIPLFITYAETGLVPRFPTGILATGLMIMAALSFFAGLILDTVTRGRRETRLLAYLAVPVAGRRHGP